MTVRECYEKIGSDFDKVLGRMGSEALVKRFAVKFLEDKSFEELTESLKEKDGEDQEEVAKASGCITRQGIGVQITWIAGILLLLITMLWFLFF